MTEANKPAVKILYICIGNACRSQMAEAWTNHFSKGRVQASSAGMYPFGSIPEGISAVMGEKGVSLEGQWSKGLRAVALAEMDVVVTMGREVEWPMPAGFKRRVVNWNILDPFGQGIEIFRNVRDMIERQVLELLAELIAPDAPA